jgi:hypothetical protein
MSDISNLPVDLAIDLDAAERPADEVKPPFRAKVADRVITMKDPSDLDWRDLMNLTDPREFIRLSMDAEDRQFLARTPIPGWKFNQLMEAFYHHYDLEELAAQARREQTLRSV